MNPIFCLETTSTDSSLLIIAPKESKDFTVFTKRSIQRQSTFIKNKIQELLAQNKRLIWIAPYYAPLFEQLRQDNFIWISPVLSSQSFDPPSNIDMIQNTQQIDHFINTVHEQDKYEVITHPVIVKLNEFTCIQQAIKNIFYRCALRIKTIKHFGKIWQYNFFRNKPIFAKGNFIDADFLPSIDKPEIMLGAGPSLNQLNFKELKNKKIWIVDTALQFCLSHNIIPDRVFCVDSGKGSYEHFISNIKQLKQIDLITDQLVFPQVLELPFKSISFYYSSNLLCQQWHNKEPKIINEVGNVLGLMVGTFKYLFKNQDLPKTYGNDGMQHQHFVTHVNPAAYFRTAYRKQHRYYSCENYFFSLSQKLYKKEKPT